MLVMMMPRMQLQPSVDGWCIVMPRSYATNATPGSIHALPLQCAVMNVKYCKVIITAHNSAPAVVEVGIMFHVRSGVEIGRMRSRGYRVIEGAFYPKFLAPPSGKLCLGCENVLQGQECYEPPLSPCRLVALRRSSNAAEIRKISVYCSLRFILTVCERHFAINALEYENDVAILG